MDDSSAPAATVRHGADRSSTAAAGPASRLAPEPDDRNAARLKGAERALRLADVESERTASVIRVAIFAAIVAAVVVAQSAGFDTDGRGPDGSPVRCRRRVRLYPARERRPPGLRSTGPWTW